MNSVPLLLALRYLKAAKPRSIRIYLVPFIALACMGVLYGLDHAALNSSHQRVLGFHAEWARAIGNAKWIGWLAFVIVATFVATLRRLTIFTTMSTYGMFIGTAALVIVLSVMSGFEADIKGKILGTHAHVVVTRVDESFLDGTERLAQVQKTPGVLGAAPFLSSEAMIASPANRSNVVVKGIDPATVGSVTDLSKNMVVGELPSLAHPEQIKTNMDVISDDDLLIHQDGDPPKKPGDAHAAEVKRRSPPGIIIGRELANSLHVYLGDDVSMVSPTGGIGPTGSTPKARPYRVAGIFYSGMFEYDSKFAYVTLASAQKLFDQPDEITGLEIKVPDPDDTDAVVAALGKTLGAGYEVADWKSLNRSLFSALALEKIVMFVFLMFIILVAAFSIIANGQMIATQKIGEIAILKSMGATDGTIAKAFLLLGTMLGVLGVVAGVCGGLFGAYALQRWGYGLDPDIFYLTQLPVKLNAHEIEMVGAAGILVTMLATVQPAWLASRMTPVEGLREGGH